MKLNSEDLTSRDAFDVMLNSQHRSHHHDLVLEKCPLPHVGYPQRRQKHLVQRSRIEGFSAAESKPLPIAGLGSQRWIDDARQSHRDRRNRLFVHVGNGLGVDRFFGIGSGPAKPRLADDLVRIRPVSEESKGARFRRRMSRHLRRGERDAGVKLAVADL